MGGVLVRIWELKIPHAAVLAACAACTRVSGAYDAGTGGTTFNATTTQETSTDTTETTVATARPTTGSASESASRTTGLPDLESSDGAATASDSDSMETQSGSDTEPADCVIDSFSLEDVAFLVSGSGGESFTNFGATSHHDLYDAQANGGTAALLLRVPELDDLTDVEFLHLGLALSMDLPISGTLHAALMPETICEWDEGTQDGSGPADGVTWAACHLTDAMGWPEGGPIAAAGLRLGQLPLQALPPPEREGIVRVEFSRDVSELDAVEERSVLLYVEGPDEGRVGVFTDDAIDAGHRPKVSLQRCR